MPFITNDQPAKGRRIPVEEIDKKRADIIHRVAIRTGRRVTRWSRNDWAYQLAILRNELVGPPAADDRIDTVLQWYEKFAGTDPRIPRADSGKSFRKKFTNIELAMTIRMGRNPEQGVETSPLAKEIATEIKDWGWPADQLHRLEAVVELSLRSYDNFRERVVKAKRSLEQINDAPSRRLADYCQQILYHLGQRKAFVTARMKLLNKDVKYWSSKPGGWKGSLARHALNTESEAFRDELRDCCRAYGGAAGGKVWEKLEGLLK